MATLKRMWTMIRNMSMIGNIHNGTVLDSRGKAIAEGSDARMRYPWAQRDGNQI